MVALKLYRVKIRGVEHTMQLTAEHAKRLNAVEVPSKQRTPRNKSASPSNK